jgi:hypothetical protein
MKDRALLVLIVTSVLGLLACGAVGQDATVAPDPSAKLVFGDGDDPPLYAIGDSRMITYRSKVTIFQSRGGDGSRAMVADKIVTFETGATVDSVSADGRTAIIAISNSGTNAHLFLLDTATGQRQDIPTGWYDPGVDPDAALSGDGRLISLYSESDTSTPMTVMVYDWPTKTLVAKRTSEIIAAGGGFGGGVTADGAVEFANNRVGRKVVNLKTGALIGRFGPYSVRSSNGAWVVEFPDLRFNESAPKVVVLKRGTGGETVAKLGEQVPDDELYGGMNGAFCGTSGRFVLGSGHGVAAYAIPSGKLLTSFPAATWRDASTDDRDYVSIACSSKGTHVAILSGRRLTFHDLK